LFVWTCFSCLDSFERCRVGIGFNGANQTRIFLLWRCSQINEGLAQLKMTSKESHELLIKCQITVMTMSLYVCFLAHSLHYRNNMQRITCWFDLILFERSTLVKS
jgi:hypothetical protein